MLPHDSALDLAKRLHALTCVLSETPLGSDEFPSLLAERQKVIDLLECAPKDDRAHPWIERTMALDIELSVTWSAALGTLTDDLRSNKLTRGAIMAYRRQSSR